MKIIFTILLSLVLVKCGSTEGAPNMQRNLLLIGLGSTKSEVLNIMGAPAGRSFWGEAEAWTYCAAQPSRYHRMGGISGANGFGVTTNQIAVLWFAGDSVAALTEETQRWDANKDRTPDKGCDALPAIDWGKIPADLSIELRNR